MLKGKHVLGALMLVSIVVLPLQAAHAESLLGRLTLLPLPTPPKPLTISSFFPTIDHLSIERSLSSPLLLDLIAALTKSCSLATASSPGGTSTTATPPIPPAASSTVAVAPVFSSYYNEWEINSGFNDNTVWSAYTDPGDDGDIGTSLSADPLETDLPTSLPIEIFMADTNGQYLVDRCAQPAFTSNVASDLSCYVNEAIAQGYPYELGQHAALASTT